MDHRTGRADAGEVGEGAPKSPPGPAPHKKPTLDLLFISLPAKPSLQGLKLSTVGPKALGQRLRI